MLAFVEILEAFNGFSNACCVDGIDIVNYVRRYGEVTLEDVRQAMVDLDIVPDGEFDGNVKDVVLNRSAYLATDMETGDHELGLSFYDAMRVVDALIVKLARKEVCHD